MFNISLNKFKILYTNSPSTTMYIAENPPTPHPSWGWGPHRRERPFFGCKFEICIKTAIKTIFPILDPPFPMRPLCPYLHSKPSNSLKISQKNFYRKNFTHKFSAQNLLFGAPNALSIGFLSGLLARGDNPINRWREPVDPWCVECHHTSYTSPRCSRDPYGCAGLAACQSFNVLIFSMLLFACFSVFSYRGILFLAFF